MKKLLTSLFLSLLFPMLVFAQTSPIIDVLNDSLDDSIVTIEGRITLFEDEDEMFVVDPTGKIWVELEDRHEEMGLKKGQEVEITGEIDVNFFTNSKKLKAIDITILK